MGKQYLNFLAPLSAPIMFPGALQLSDGLTGIFIHVTGDSPKLSSFQGSLHANQNFTTKLSKLIQTKETPGTGRFLAMVCFVFHIIRQDECRAGPVDRTDGYQHWRTYRWSDCRPTASKAVSRRLHLALFFAF